MMKRFSLHPQLAADTLFVADWALSRVLLMDDARFPWLLLVPRRDGIRELHELSHAESMVLIEEIRRAGSALKALFSADKINTGALGNIVPQLHVHVIARKIGDASWPGPVWGQGQPQRYAPEAGATLRERLVTSL